MEDTMTTAPDDEEDRWVDGSLEAGADDAPPVIDSVPTAGDIPAGDGVDEE
jgi:hypothetical protein